MNDKNTGYLLENYTNLYRNKMYFECKDGWFDIINQLSRELEKMIAVSAMSQNVPEILAYAEQVKEKYGTLRFYLNRGTDEMYQAIVKAEVESKSTCEICGKEGKLSSDPWLSTLCEEHLK